MTRTTRKIVGRESMRRKTQKKTLPHCPVSRLNIIKPTSKKSEVICTKQLSIINFSVQILIILYYKSIWFEMEDENPALECEVCGGTDFHKESGHFYCNECQTQSQQVQEHVFEIDDGSAKKTGTKKIQVWLIV